MVHKKMLPSRLDQDLIAKLQNSARAHDISVNDLIWNALDALEREERIAETVTERLEFLEENVALLVSGTSEHFEKMDQLFADASADEKDRLRSLFRLLESKLIAHDMAEQERFEKLKPEAL